MPDEIWLVDFKTDEIRSHDLENKKKLYEPQLRLYAAALEKIFARKVARRMLYFLAAGVEITVGDGVRKAPSINLQHPEKLQ